MLLYFRVGQIVSAKVSQGAWGENTVTDLAGHIEQKHPELKGFNRRGLYRMKQFFEMYSDEVFISTFSKLSQKTEQDTTMKIQGLLAQLPWSSHLYIISKTKTAEEKIFYIQLAISERWSVREVERQLNSAVFERTILANQKVSTVLTQLPQNFLKILTSLNFLIYRTGIRRRT